MIDKKLLAQLPHSAVQELINLRILINVLYSKNIDHVELREIDEDLSLYQFTDKLTGYAFVISIQVYDDTSKRITYVIYSRPATENNLAGRNYEVAFDKIEQAFEKWIEAVHLLNKIKYEYLNPLDQFYTAEFSGYFTNDDEDAAYNPFDINRQDVIYTFLTYAEYKVEKSESISQEQKNELLLDLSDLKKEIPQATKKKFVFNLSITAKKIKQMSNSLFHDVFDVLKKELIKKVLFEGVEHIPNAIGQVESWIHLLTQ